MDNVQPILEPGTVYRIELQGQVDVNWLRSLDALAENIVDEAVQSDETTMLSVRADQSGIVGLVRNLHGLGVTILQFQMITQKEK